MSVVEHTRINSNSAFDPLADPLWIARFQDFVTIDVRYCETDSARHVNHVSLPAYLEHGLLKLLTRIGDPEWAGGLPFDHVTAELRVRYIEPSVFGESLRVGSKVVHVGRKSAAVEQVILGERETVRAVARTVIVRSKDGRSEPWSNAQRASLLANLSH